MTTNLTAAIVCYENEEDELRAAIESCLSCNAISRLYIVDNSKDDRLMKLCTDGRISYQHNPKNVGFGAAHNQVINQVIHHSDYHLIMNPDVTFRQETLTRLLAFIDQHTDIGAVMPKVIYPGGELQRLCKLLPSPVDLFGRRFFAGSRWQQKQDSRYELHQFNYDQVLDVPNLSGCFMLLRTAVLRQVGGFDERYFLYLEDLDLSRRVGDHSRTVYFPGSTVTHTYKKQSYRQISLLWKHTVSAIKYFNKWGWINDGVRKDRNKKTLEQIGAFTRQRSMTQ